MSDNVVLCPFWRESRSHFGVRVCDNLVGGVPACVVANFYPDLSYEEEVEELKRERAGLPRKEVVGCRHFVRVMCMMLRVLRSGSRGVFSVVCVFVLSLMASMVVVLIALVGGDGSPNWCEAHSGGYG